MDTAPKPARRGFRGTEENSKTRLCTRWEAGECRFGDRCNFAHGPGELRPLPPRNRGRPGRQASSGASDPLGIGGRYAQGTLESGGRGYLAVPSAAAGSAGAGLPREVSYGSPLLGREGPGSGGYLGRSEGADGAAWGRGEGAGRAGTAGWGRGDGGAATVWGRDGGGGWGRGLGALDRSTSWGKSESGGSGGGGGGVGGGGGGSGGSGGTAWKPGIVAGPEEPWPARESALDPAGGSWARGGRDAGTTGHGWSHDGTATAGPSPTRALPRIGASSGLFENPTGTEPYRPPSWRLDGSAGLSQGIRDETGPGGASPPHLSGLGPDVGVAALASGRLAAGPASSSPGRFPPGLGSPGPSGRADLGPPDPARGAGAFGSLHAASAAFDAPRHAHGRRAPVAAGRAAPAPGAGAGAAGATGGPLPPTGAASAALLLESLRGSSMRLSRAVVGGSPPSVAAAVATRRDAGSPPLGGGTASGSLPSAPASDDAGAGPATAGVASPTASEVDRAAWVASGRPVRGPGGWTQYQTIRGERYYHHPSTGVTEWDPPAEWAGLAAQQ